MRDVEHFFKKGHKHGVGTVSDKVSVERTGIPYLLSIPKQYLFETSVVDSEHASFLEGRLTLVDFAINEIARFLRVKPRAPRAYDNTNDDEIKESFHRRRYC